ncbi:MAG: DUF6600 domain-containing protein [Acidobacteriota bacterium]
MPSRIKQPYWLVLFFLLASSLQAKENTPFSRVSELDGTAAYEPAQQVDWTQVAINLPVTEGDRFFVHEQSRMEIELSSGNFLRLGPETDLVFEKLANERAALQMTLGELILRLKEDSVFKIGTPGAHISIDHSGLYRIDVNESGEVSVVVSKGELEVINEASALRLGSGERLVVTGPRDPLSPTARTYVKDDLDTWSDRLDARNVSRQASDYLGGTYTGAYDLDRHGQWDYHSSYGVVWYPRVSAGWWPYRQGNWIYYPGWGWTWVSYEPWGWLPYHYGRWSHVNSRWCWIPGNRFSRWSPALVDFYYGNGFVGWSPRGFSWDSFNGIRGSAGGSIGTPPRTGLTVVSADDFVQRGGNRDLPKGKRLDDLRPVGPPATRGNSVSPGGPTTVTIIGKGAQGAVSPNGPRRESARTPASSEGPRVITVPGRTPETRSSAPRWDGNRIVIPDFNRSPENAPQEPPNINRAPERRLSVPTRPSATRAPEIRNGRSAPPRTAPRIQAPVRQRQQTPTRPSFQRPTRPPRQMPTRPAPSVSAPRRDSESRQSAPRHDPK